MGEGRHEIHYIRTRHPYEKRIWILFAIVGSLIISIPQLTSDVQVIIYLSSGFLAVLIATVGLIASRILTDKTSEEIRILKEKLDHIEGKLDKVLKDYS